MNLPIKRKQLYSALLFMLLAWTSCSQETMVRDLICEEEFEKAYTPAPVTSLTSFAGYDLIVLSSRNEVFSWTPSELQESSLMVVKYEVLYGKENDNFQGNDKSLLYVKISDTQGIAATLTIHHNMLNDIAAKAGIGYNEIGTIAWKVRTYCGSDMNLSKITGYFRVLRPAKNTTVAKVDLNASIPYYIDTNNCIHYIKTN